jgi:hypothetical protein
MINQIKQQKLENSDLFKRRMMHDLNDAAINKRFTLN